MYIARKFEGTILKYLNTPEVLALVGPRQSGKTTLLKHIFKSISNRSVFLTFEDNKLLNLFVHNIDDFIKTYVKPYDHVFIDEFNYAKQGGKLLKYIVDTVGTKLIISGSSSVDLAVQAVKYLVGRIFIFSLYPLDFEEFISYEAPDLLKYYAKHKINLEKNIVYNKVKNKDEGNINKLRRCYQKYAIYGGYPRVVISKDVNEKKTVLRNIYNTYFLREVKDILGLADDYKLAQMIKSLALQIGNLVEYREMSKVSELSFQTVKSYVNFLEKTFVSKFVKPFFINKRTEIVKNPKVYFFDTGLRNYIIDDFRDINDRPDAGALLENTAAVQLVKKDLPFKFWRSKKKSEVDFVIDLPDGKKLALEIKKSASISDFNSTSIRDFKNKYTNIPLVLSSYEKVLPKTKENILQLVFL